jgi:hypothetical protein
MQVPGTTLILISDNRLARFIEPALGQNRKATVKL